MNLLLEKARKTLRTADHMIYVTYPILKEKRILVKVLEELNEIMLSIINAILQHEYLMKRIRLYSDAKANFETFETECALRYGIDHEQLSGIQEVLQLAELHKGSVMEFIRKDRFVILSENMQPESVTLEKLKRYVSIAKGLIAKTEQIINNRSI